MLIFQEKKSIKKEASIQQENYFQTLFTFLLILIQKENAFFGMKRQEKNILVLKFLIIELKKN